MQKFKFFLKQIPRHWVVAGSAWGSKLITSAIQILSIRALLSYLGADKYAVYVIAFSLAGWIMLAESGIGISLQNYISECRAKQQNYDKYLLSSLQIIICLFVFFLIMLLIFATPVQSILFRKFTYIQGLTDTPIIAASGVVILFSAFTNIAYRIYYAKHKGYISNILPAAASIISMILIVVVNRFNSSNESSILLALLVFTVPQLLCALIPFVKTFKDIIFKIFKVDKIAIKEILTRALKFHGIAILYATLIQTDYIIISQTLKSSDIVSYNIFMKVFLFLSFIYASLLTASWPVFSEMYIKKDFSTIKKMIKKYLLWGSLFFIAGTIAIYIFSESILHILAPEIKDIIPTMLLIFLFGVHTFLTAGWNGTFSTVIQSANILKIFWIYMPIQVILNATLQYFLSKNYGIEGILTGSILSALLTAFWILPVKVCKMLKENVQ